MKHARSHQADPRRANPSSETPSDDLASATWGLPSGSRLKRAAAEDHDAVQESIDAALRELDTAGCEQIFVEAPPESPEWAAVRDRLVRACSGE